MMSPRRIPLALLSKNAIYEEMAKAIIESFGGSESFNEACDSVYSGKPLSNSRGYENAARTLFLFTRQRKSFIESFRQVAETKDMDDKELIVTLIHKQFPEMDIKNIHGAYRTLCDHDDFTGVKREVIHHCYVVQNHIVLEVVESIINKVNKLRANTANAWAVMGHKPTQNKPGQKTDTRYITFAI